MKITVLIPTYNRAHLLKECLSSVLNQTHKNFEIIVSDNCSTDNTWDLLKRYKRKYKMIKIHRQKSNQGSNRNLKYLINISKGKYCSLLFDDDFWQPDFLYEMNRILENDRFKYIYSDTQWVNKKSKLIKKPFLNIKDGIIPRYSLLKENHIYGMTNCVFFNSPKFSLRDESLAGDLAFSLELNLLYDGYHIKKYLYNYRFHESNESQLKDLYERSIGIFDSLKSIYMSIDKKNRTIFESGVLNKLYYQYFFSNLFLLMKSFNFSRFMDNQRLLKTKTKFFRKKVVSLMRYLTKTPYLLMTTFFRIRTEK
jgi:glycosyltransferase involved in cell wall biosynthesis